ncbi:MAG: hydratase [Betaproteobacteria bacterium]|nr:hydratase [Betaproteobacteria bacterium]
MNDTNARQAAALLWETWQAGRRLPALPAGLRPGDEDEGFLIQKEITALSGSRRFGWKIAATSTAGQEHIGVSGPLVGTLLESRVMTMPAAVSMAGNAMGVAEAEFAFRMGRSLAPRSTHYEVGEVMDAVAAMHPAIEVPDSRYEDFVTSGAPQLLADNACASWFVLGDAAPDAWRTTDLVTHEVTVRVNDAVVGRGTGANVLGDPRVALTWIANRLSAFGTTLAEGEVVTTGTCVVPFAVAPGDRVVAEYGAFGRIEVAFVA